MGNGPIHGLGSVVSRQLYYCYHPWHGPGMSGHETRKEAGCGDVCGREKLLYLMLTNTYFCDIS